MSGPFNSRQVLAQMGLDPEALFEGLSPEVQETYREEAARTGIDILDLVTLTALHGFTPLEMKVMDEIAAATLFEDN